MTQLKMNSNNVKVVKTKMFNVSNVVFQITLSNALFVNGD